MRWCRSNSSDSAEGPAAESYEHGNEPFGSIEARSFLTS
jgi:hypothetical protein